MEHGELIFAKEQAKVANVVISKAEKYNRSLIEASLDPLVTIGPNGIITDVNNAAENATGLPRVKLIGTDFSKYFTEPSKAQAGYQQAFKDGKVVDYELKLKHISGYSTPVLYNASVYKDDEGKTIGVFAAARDITTTRKAEDQLIYLKNNLELLVNQRTAELQSVQLLLKSSLESPKDMIILSIDQNYHYYYFNKAHKDAMKDAYGKEVAIGMNLLGVITSETDRLNTKFNCDLALKGKSHSTILKHGSKESRYYETFYNPIINESNEIIGATAFAIDVSERILQEMKIKELNNQLEYRVIERTAQLESANRELEAFSYSVSHDLKAPLRHITGYISLLVKKYMDLLPEEGRHYFDNISYSAKNMGELIDGLLQFSKTGRIDMNQRLLDINEIVASLIQPIKEQDTERRIEFNINPLPLVFGDFAMISSVWSNLIENAVKFTKNNNLAKLTIGAEENENDIIYYIKDNGAGFDMNYASKLFTVFQRLHSRENYEGTGIGLATVHRIIARHGGKTWAEGKVGEGATFYFSLIKRKESE